MGAAMSDPHEVKRQAMIKMHLQARGIRDLRVLTAFQKVPRHRFVPEEHTDEAYADHPLPIGHHQTISQPYMVALMSQCLELTGRETVLEIGTGSAYQTAILCELAGQVYSVERIPSLSESAVATLRDLDYHNYELLTADGTLGWPSKAPFDRIVVTAAAPRVPDALKGQLKDGGILVMPVGPALSQQLTVLRREGDRFRPERVCECIFVKLIGSEGYSE